MTILEALKLAHYKIGEMLHLGSFEGHEVHNFERAREQIKEVINRYESNQP